MNRTFLRILVVAAFIAAGLAAYSVGALLRPLPDLHGSELVDPQPVEDLRLVAANGEEVSLAEYRGEWTLVFFGYTRCPDICPITMAILGTMYLDLGEPENLNVVLVTVDPEHDTPEIIQRYARGFHPDFVGLSGPQEWIDEAADRFYVSHQPVHNGIIHSEPVMLVDPESRFWRIYNSEALMHLEGDLRLLLSGA